MRVILDTNVLLVALPSYSPYRLIFDKLLEGAYQLCLSNEILNESRKDVFSSLFLSWQGKDNTLFLTMTFDRE